VEVVRFLLESGDDQNVLGDLGATPLHIAAERGHLETWMMHRYLMDRHAKSSSCSLRFVRKNPSWLGVGNPHHWISFQEVVRYLLEMRADQNKVNQRGAPPIHMAAMSGHLTVVQLLVEFGTDKDQSDRNGAGGAPANVPQKLTVKPRT